MQRNVPGGFPRPSAVASEASQLLWVKIFKSCVSAVVWVVAPKFGGAEVHGVVAGTSGAPPGVTGMWGGCGAAGIMADPDGRGTGKSFLLGAKFKRKAGFLHVLPS